MVTPGLIAINTDGMFATMGLHVGGNRARRWTPTQQPPDSPSPLRRKAVGGPLGSGQRNYGLATTFAPLTDPTLRLLLT
jgi:hypothetical protein